MPPCSSGSLLAIQSLPLIGTRTSCLFTKGPYSSSISGWPYFIQTQISRNAANKDKQLMDIPALWGLHHKGWKSPLLSKKSKITWQTQLFSCHAYTKVLIRQEPASEVSYLQSSQAHSFEVTRVCYRYWANC